MNKKFTASEVRSAIGALEARDMEYEAGMLRAFADLLEAQERAVPVVTRESAINAIEHVGRYNGPGRETEALQMLVEGSPSVAHRAPSDADGLAEPPCAAIADIAPSTTPTGCYAVADLGNLRPEVQEAVVAIDGGNGVFVNSDDGIGSEKWEVARAELLRLAKENADLLSTIDLAEQVRVQRDETMHRWIKRARNAEPELAALKARIAEAPMAQLIDQGRATQRWYVRATDGGLLALPPTLSGKRVRLVVEE